MRIEEGMIVDYRIAFAENLAFYARRGYQEYRRATVIPGTVVVYMKKTIA